MSRLDNDNASLQSFSAWMQEADISHTLSTTMQSLTTSASSLRFSSRSLRLVDCSATALWNAFVRFLGRVGVDEVKGGVVTGIHTLYTNV